MNTKTKIRFLATAALTGALGFSASASAQLNEQKPYVLIVMDTSGSTEWTPEGDEEYPFRPAIDPKEREWVPGTPMEITPGSIAAGPSRFGPCMVWEVDACNKYRRPAWSFQYADWQDVFSGQALLNTRKTLMQGVYSAVPLPTNYNSPHTGVRFIDDPVNHPNMQMPRHVILKEVLTGDMVMKATADPRGYEALSPVYDGPGCWFVPRQRDASVQPDEDKFYCAGEDRFEKLPDHDEPRPHFQEVFDFQVGNGVLDKLGSQAIFAVAMLDGYRDKVSGWPFELNDAVDGTAKIVGTTPAGATATGNGAGEETSPNYNLGVYRITGPKQLDIPPQFFEQLSKHVQTTIIDAGFVREDSKAGKIDVKKGVPSLGLAYDKKADKYIQDGYEFAKHPVARATPLAAAMMDVHQFFANDDRFESGTSGGRDPYGECRPKSVVLISDGYPEPEAGTGVGSETLTPAFGYDPALYPYRETETEIDALVTNPALQGTDPVKYAPRVHVVALSVANEASRKEAILQKLTDMAIDGNTCASYYLPDHVPVTRNGNDCVEVGRCLVGPASPPTYTFVPTDPSAAPKQCDYPALVLQSNDRGAIEQALFSVMSSIVGGGGTITRTKAAMSNFLDDDDFTAGGQYRTYSGAQTIGAYWRGILNREVIPCEDTGAVNFDSANSEATAGIDGGSLGVRALHADIGDQVDCGVDIDGTCQTEPPTDNRRVFTSFPSADIYDYTSKSPITQDNGTRFPFLWQHASLLPTAEEFRESNYPGSIANDALVVGTRIPFRAEQINDTIVATNTAEGIAWDAAKTAIFMNTTDPSALTGVVRNHRGQIPAKGTNVRTSSRVFSGILNSDPVVVPPPILDLPIESYRAFRAFYGDRPTMMYSATVDGQLHAIHMGDLKGRIKVRAQTSDNNWTDLPVDPTRGAEVDRIGGVQGQREAWSYIPNMLVTQLANNVLSQAYIMDGSTSVRDVRLCQADATKNQSPQACLAIKDMGALTAEQQWRTVLVQALGQAGAGYFAMDVTRTGGLRPGEASRTVEGPDPVVLWEFDRVWEMSQVKALYARDRELVAPSSGLLGSRPDDGCSDDEAFWSSPALGLSISDAEIATLAVEDENGDIQQRPVAVFAAGAADADATGCGAGLQGSALYVVDMQTGSLLRRFVTYFDGTTEESFAKSSDSSFDTRFGRIQLTGSPSLFDASTGALASRGFVGDSIGRLYRIDFRDPDPAAWKMDLFFDPYDTTKSDLQTDANTIFGSTVNFGPAAFKPAISRGPARQLVVTYGLGERGELTSANLAQAIITISENVETLDPEVQWFQVLEKGEKLTGEPIVFDSVTYFPTYWVEDAEVCNPGRARIWGVQYFEGDSSFAPIGVFDIKDPDFDGNPDVSLSPGATATSPAVWFSPITPTVIRGLALTLGPVCSVRNLNDDGYSSTDTEGADTQPQLVAQTGAPAGAMSGRLKADASNDSIGRITKNLKRPRSMTVPLSWSVIQ